MSEFPALLPPPAPRRALLHDELHARPVAPIRVPALVTHLALLNQGVTADDEKAHLAELLAEYRVPMPTDGSDASFLQVSLPELSLKWERHREFSSYSLTQPLDQAQLRDAEEPDLLGLVPVPPAWLRGIPGRTLVAVQLVFLGSGGADAEQAAERAQRLLGPGRLLGSAVKTGSARLFTTYRLRADGTSRFAVLCEDDVTEGRAGRIAASLLETETYRMLALQALAPARRLAPRLAEVESRLAGLTHAIDESREPDQVLLHDLMLLAAEIETDIATHRVMFAATHAYFDIVQDRIDDLRGTSLPGLMGVFTFLRRRLLPAMATIEATDQRLADLSERTARAATLLRTRVEITTEAQSQELLKALHQGQRVQLRLQETVEGLSIAAIAYYVVGLLGYLGKGLKAGGLHLNLDLFTGSTVPLVVLAVWFTLRRVRAKLRGPDGEP